MNLRSICGGWDESETLLPGQFAQQPRFGFQHCGFIAFESFLGIRHPAAQQPVEQQRQLPRQRHVGRQPACTKCGATLTEGSLGSLCPRCFLLEGLAPPEAEQADAEELSACPEAPASATAAEAALPRVRYFGDYEQC